MSRSIRATTGRSRQNSIEQLPKSFAESMARQLSSRCCSNSPYNRRGKQSQVAASEFRLPALGDIVYCRFPEVIGKPGPKPRPALVVGFAEWSDKTRAVIVAYGTSQRTTRLHSGEFLISPDDGEGYRAAGLSFSTKFDLHHTATLPYTDEWFRVPPIPSHGQTPKLGILHPSLMRRAHAAFTATLPPQPT